MSTPLPAMPCLESGFHGFHHTVDSALEVLAGLEISPERISLEMDGRGYPSRWVVAQDPAPGAELGPGVRIKLTIAGLGYFHTLPVGMWDSGGDQTIGTKEIVGVFDDPLQKTAHWLREGARLFDLQPENFDACSRWISLFGVDPETWPPEIRYNLSLLLPSLQRLAASEHGIRLIFHLLLNLQVQEIRLFPVFRPLPDQDCSLLGESFSHLGTDLILGNQTEDLSGLLLRIGPISLDDYYANQQRERKRLLGAVLDLCMSVRRRCFVSWLVSDPQKAPRLGVERENSRLGINSHLGRPEPVEV
jgi:Type VI secretion, TssG